MNYLIYSYKLSVTFEQIQDTRHRQHDRLSSSPRQSKDSQDNNVMTNEDWDSFLVLVRY